jgi:hypothetical protein
MEPSPSHRKADASRLNSRHRPNKSRQASCVTNGTRLLLPDNPRAYLRRYSDLLNAYVADAGGWDGVSNSEMALIRRISTLVVECERREATFSRGGGFDDTSLSVFQTTVNSLRRCLETLCSGSLKRQVSKDITPLRDILKQIEAEEAAAANDKDAPCL